MYNEVDLETLCQFIMFLFLPIGSFYLFYLIVQQIRFWKGMRKMSLKQFVEKLLKILEK